MQTWKGRPELTIQDYPQTVYRALLGSVAIYNRTEGEEKAFNWVKTSADAREGLQDAFGMVDPLHSNETFRPDGKALLYMTIDQLETALVMYGSRLHSPGAEQLEFAELDKSVIDELLVEVDKLKASQ